MNDEPVIVTRGIAEEHRADAGRIVYAAFRRKLQALLGRREGVERALAAGLMLDMALGAFAGGRLVGVAGLHYDGRQLFGLGLRQCLRELGPLRGLYSWLAMGLFTAGSCPPGQLRIAALAVDEGLRGQGVGSRLLDASMALAQALGKQAVRLEVVDTNRRARQLYERSGFAITAIWPMPFPRSWLGYGSAIEMVRPLSARLPGGAQ